MRILARYTKKVGALDTVCRWRVRPWAALLISRFFSSTLRQAGRAKAEDLDVFQAVNTLQHQGFQLPQPGAVAQPHATARFHGNQREHHADYQVHRQQHGGEQGVKPQRQPQGDAGQDYHGEQRANGVGKEKLHRLNVGHGDIQDVPLLPVHQAGGGQGPDLLKQGDPHGGQQLVGPGVGDPRPPHTGLAQ